MDNRELEIFELEIFELEIKRQCEIFFMSIEYLDQYLQPEKSVPSEVIWYHIQSFLTSSANISRLLWGDYSKNSDTREKIRKKLREKLGVSEDSKLKHRKMRNFFEHFDEHIEKVVRKPNAHYIDSNIGPKTAIFVGSNDTQFLRNFDPVAAMITFKDYEYDMNEIIVEIDKIYTENLVK
ncbi:hypothetical protein [Bacillus altitudinis]|uniref:hypothetical protein n=1 Tax=Bacillus altitudinis TaxID=293387 RepID=UPI0014597A0F|nr:hypothetical protein [Bacillus altitudinis]MDI6562366.1 hypothetical protein [Bacillus altitudinis]NMF14832.1 hypothetical protein [Bacillus altitudinis]